MDAREAERFAEQEIARHMQRFPRSQAKDLATYDANVQKWKKIITDRYQEVTWQRSRANP